MSLAWKYKAQVKQAQAAAVAKAMLAGNQEKQIRQMAADVNRYQLLADSLENDCKRISSLPQGEARNQVKRDELIPQYRKYVDAYLSGGEVYANQVLVQVMIWAFDVGDIDLAVKLAEIAVAQDQSMPERFNRDLKTFVADAVLEWAQAQRTGGNPVEPYFGGMFALVTTWPIHDVIKAKYHKFAAENATAEDPAKALELYRRALEIDPDCKVKTAMAKLEKALAAAK